MELSALSAAGSGKEPLDGTLVLEHAYEVGSRLGSSALYATYSATQRPFGRSVHIRLYHRLDALGLPPEARTRLEAQLESGGEGAWALDFGQVGPDMPFLVLLPPPETTLVEWFERHRHSPEAIAQLASRLWRLGESLDASRRCDLVLSNLYVREREASDPHLVLYAIGDGLGRDEVREMTGLVDRELVLGFPPECFVPPAAEDTGLEQGDAADVYRVCAVLYELLTGRHPYFLAELDVAASVAELVNPIGRRPGPVATQHPGLDAWVGAGLARDPSDRPSGAEFQQRLEALAAPGGATGDSSEPSSTEPGESSMIRTSRLPAVLVWTVRLIVLLLVGLGTFLLTHRPPDTVSLLITSQPSGVRFERLGGDGMAELLGRSPLILPGVPIDQPVRLRPIYEDGRPGEVQSVRPDRLEDAGACRVLDVRFE